MKAGHVVIVGAGQAGGRTAQALRRNGHAGPITLLGNEPSPPYERPPLSKDVLTGSATAGSLQLLPSEQWRALAVELRLNAQAEAIDRAARTVRLASGERIGYDALVLATGARPRPFPGRVEPGAGFFYLRSLQDAERLRGRLTPGTRVAVIGAGFIGMELAASARKLGLEVTLVEAAERPLARLLPASVADWLVGRHRANGVAVHLATAVEALAPGRVLLAGERRIEAEVTIVGVGACPNDELAAAAGLAVQGGVLVDAGGRSSDPAIYAVGDVARQLGIDAQPRPRLESWRHAEDSAQAVAAALCGMPLPAETVPWFWSDQYGRNIQLAGRPQDTHDVVLVGEPDRGPALWYFLEGEVVRGAVGVDCGREVRGAMKLIQAGRAVERGQLPRPRAAAPALACGAGAPAQPAQPALSSL